MTEEDQVVIAERIAQRLHELQQRPTLQQLQAIAGEWACPRCGCEDWRVVDSRMVDNGRKRIRACRNCSQRLQTIEIISE
jgi:transcription elongation factor Elf1